MTHPQASLRHSIAAPDGRQLEVQVTGPDGGLPLVFHNGTPCGLGLYQPMLRAAADRGLRTVLYARPGYGQSTEQPGRRVADAAADVAAILDQLDAAEFVTIGWSGGGPHALACAALLPDRCRAAVSMAGVAPYHAAGLDWLAGMGPENLEEFGAAAQGQAALSRFLDEAAGLLRALTAADLVAGMGGLLSPADQAVLTGDLAEYLAGAFRDAVSPGIAGWRDDDLAFTAEWGFGVEACGAVPVAIWQGGQDRMVPAGHGDWLAANVPGARVRRPSGEGHLTLAVTSFGQILDDLTELAASG
jgi:pimeloyl-ACP methyl ester carboxylesterase